MKKFLINNKKYVLIALFGFFLLIVGVSYAFTGPSAPPPNGQPLSLIINKLDANQLKDGDPATPEPPFIGDYSLRVTKSSGPNKVAIGTEGLLAWTVDVFADNLNRAIISYGKLIVDLSEISGVGNYARTAVKLFTNSDNSMVNVITNKPILGFWLDTASGTDGWATGFFGKSALSSLILGDDVFRTSSYSSGTLYDLDIGGTTNIGQGDVCVIEPEDSCPMGSYLNAYQPQFWDGSNWTTYSDGNVNNTISLAEVIQNDPSITTHASPPFSLYGYSRMCKFFDPSREPTFFGPCNPDPIAVVLNPSHQPITNLWGDQYGYNPWYFGGPGSGPNYPPENPTTIPGSGNYTLKYPYYDSPYPGPGASPWPYPGFYSDFNLSGPLFKSEKFNVEYEIRVPEYVFTFTPNASSVPASAAGVPQSITIPTKYYTLNQTVTKNPNGVNDENTTFIGDPVTGYVDEAKQVINNFTASFNGPPPSVTNPTFGASDISNQLASNLKLKGILGTPFAHALPNFPSKNVSGPLFFWFLEKMTIERQCIYPVSSHITVTPGVNIGAC